MGRALGSNAKANTAFEGVPGVTPAGGATWFVTPFVSHTLGAEQPLIASDLLGEGREVQDPTKDVVTNTGDIVVPVDLRNFGRWLKLFFGAPATAGDADDGYTHVFTSGAAELPSMSIEIGSPEVPAWSTHYLARGNQLKISMTRSGLLNATCSLICKGESPIANAPAAGNAPTPLAVQRFAQATGYIQKDGAALGSIVSADFTFSNNLEAVETIQPDGEIEDSDPGQVSMTGSITARFKDRTLLDVATGGDPIGLGFGWSLGAGKSLLFAVPRVFLPRVKKPISGAKGIQVQFDWQASGAVGASCTATLENDVADYA